MSEYDNIMGGQAETVLELVAQAAGNTITLAQSIALSTDLRAHFNKLGEYVKGLIMKHPAHFCIVCNNSEIIRSSTKFSNVFGFTPGSDGVFTLHFEEPEGRAGEVLLLWNHDDNKWDVL
ncbi:hypothetical protein DRO66_00640 [Candidatus Bathyarchaeota archaeon]|nr:MAG: hypothetical protein DRO66_00640 [Candidatus Bathyarchaeota archaeon]